ncbi:MAG TPA: cysteine--tRNA ligase [Acidobacteriota bacterium]|jgi:cysteinyl-tRNA synthetase|nr:cysteine--tRNA ligase [Acidobacteriota bacterium]HNT17715.1 cysteine--tRNA ligase [Acidobacteriota bacterium]HPA27389.1 cysteine--tRNA ligase [Acidobacteriota bacterium]HQO20141.1 cysteine--tRNA ligase [Acidobacteriota bacterium]HQQ47143.1 cysteine--tRNA ligase [Acidobacteriota bacterium]
MTVRIFNTVSRSLEDLSPIGPPKVGIYSCGPTVYDFPHIGNFRTFASIDLLRRFLKFRGYDVVSVMNITDIDDKTIKRAADEGVPLEAVTDRFTDAFYADLKTLNCMKADVHPRATKHIPEMLEICRELEKKGLTYVSGGSLYFRIGAFANYGKLSRIDKEGILENARIDNDEYEKESARDFVLWKGKKGDEPSWESPWGEGRPGWHLECSAMSRKYLGERFDIHTGGVDLVFPHHENEIAQSEGASGVSPVKYWFHVEFLLVNGEKMSKSKGNYFTLRDLLDKGCDPMAVRYLLLSVPYRRQLNFTLDGVESAKSALRRLQGFSSRLGEYGLQQLPSGPEKAGEIEAFAKAFGESMDNDLNTAEALAALFEAVRAANTMMDGGEMTREAFDAAGKLVSDFETVFGIPLKADETLEEEVERKIEEREAARKSKNFSLADSIRDELKERGILLEDTPKGVRWRRS